MKILFTTQGEKFMKIKLVLLAVSLLLVITGCGQEAEKVATTDTEVAETVVENDEEQNEEVTEEQNEDAIKESEDVNTDDNPSEEVAKVEAKQETKIETKKESEQSKQTPKKEEPTEESKRSEPVITTKNTTATESINFKTVEQNDPNLEKGKTAVAQEGQKGILTVTYKETYKDGKLASKEKISSQVTKAPVDKIVKIGTKEPQPVAKTININNLFQMKSGENLSAEQRLKAHNDSMADPEMKYYIEQINREFSKYIQGAFSWDYRNKNNRANFLAFRASGYWYDNSSLQADKLFDAIHKKVSEHQLIITPSFNYSIQDIFVHPTRGGYTVSQVLSLKYTSANGSRVEGWEPNKWYSIRYEVPFNFSSGSPSWPLWNYGDYGRLTVGSDYRVGSW
jgi:hypothetical protein